MTLVLGFAIPLLTAAFITRVLRSAGAGGTMARRWGIAILMGLAAAIGAHGMQWNQFHLPGAYSAFLVADVALSWALAGLVIAAILPRRAA